MAAVAFAALSLLLPSALAYDPLAWLVWGRDVGRLALDTTSGPSWKPLPVLFTTPLALFGGAAPALWLVVARAGALLALAGAYTLGARLAGRWAGLGSAAVLALSPWWLYNAALGNSEGLLAATALWTVIAVLAGRHHAALALLVAASLLRPEAWAFLTLYGLWLWRGRPPLRLLRRPATSAPRTDDTAHPGEDRAPADGLAAPRGAGAESGGTAPRQGADAGGFAAPSGAETGGTVPRQGAAAGGFAVPRGAEVGGLASRLARLRDRRAVSVAAAVVLVLWFGPGLVGAGGALSASHTARGMPSPGSAKLADVPAFAVLGDAATLLTVPALVAAVAGALLGGAIARRLALAALAWVAIVIVMTTAGYAGNPRYLVAAAALGAPLAGAGAVRLAAMLATRLGHVSATARPAAAARPSATARPGATARPAGATPSIGRFGAAGAAVLVGAVLAVSVGDLRAQGRELAARADSAAAFDGVIARAGGRAALLDCATIRTSVRARTLVAWRLDLRMRDLDAPPHPPTVVIRAKWFYGEGLQPDIGPGYRELVTTPDWQVVAAC